jgi:dehydrogenase/reductase SDR family protein 7B
VNEDSFGYLVRSGSENEKTDMNNFFADKVVWITGASSGIGEALAYEFARAGARLILSARNEEALALVASSCSIDQSRILVLPLDMQDSSGLEHVAHKALDQWGVVNYMIHNAGMAARALVHETEMNVYRQVMETNFFGTVSLTRAILPSMILARSGHFVVISSLSGEYGVPKLSAYAASKHALHGFFESLRAELLPYSIKISIVIPGFINTGIIEKGLDGKGQLLGKNLGVNAKGMSPGECAQRIVKGIRNGRRKILVGKMEVWTVYLNRFFPKFLSGFISNHPVRRMKKAMPFMFRH